MQITLKSVLVRKKKDEKFIRISIIFYFFLLGCHDSSGEIRELDFCKTMVLQYLGPGRQFGINTRGPLKLPPNFPSRLIWKKITITALNYQLWQWHPQNFVYLKICRSNLNILNGRRGYIAIFWELYPRLYFSGADCKCCGSSRGLYVFPQTI